MLHHSLPDRTMVVMLHHILPYFNRVLLLHHMLPDCSRVVTLLCKLLDVVGKACTRVCIFSHLLMHSSGTCFIAATDWLTN